MDFRLEHGKYFKNRRVLSLEIDIANSEVIAAIVINIRTAILMLFTRRKKNNFP